MHLALLVLAGLTLRPLDAGGPVLDVRVADVDGDGFEDIVALTASEVLLFRGGKEGVAAAPAGRFPAPPLTVVGRGLLGVVRDGAYHAVAEPFGARSEGPPGDATLFAGGPALLLSPGDLDGDGRDDPVLPVEEGMRALGITVPVAPEAKLEIARNEFLGIAWQVPVPVAGDWSGAGRELVLLSGSAVRSFAGSRETDRVDLPFSREGEEATAIRRDHALVEDVDGDGRLDLLVVQSVGTTGLFGLFEARVMLFLGGRIYDRERKGFHRPASMLKVSGMLLEPDLLDADGDGDRDLVLATVSANLVSTATGAAPGHYHLFRFDGKTYAREPAWSFEGPVPLSAFTESPQAPVVFLPDLDRDGSPEGIWIGEETRLLAARGPRFVEAEKLGFRASTRPAVGARVAAVGGPSGLLVAEGAR